VSHIAALPVWGMIFWGVVTFSILVVLHEGGHFLVARLFGVNVHEFMIGLPGPALRIHTRSGMTYGITAIPLGGYVRISGMEPGAEDPLLAAALAAAAGDARTDSIHLSHELGVPVERASALLVTLADYMAIEAAADDDVSYVAKVTRQDGETPEAFLARVRAKTYRGKKTWQRVTILASGVGVNIVAAILTFTIVLAAWGYPTASLRLAQVVPGSAAATAGIHAGDTIAGINGVTVKSWDEFIAQLHKEKPGATARIVYRRGGAVETAQVVLGAKSGLPFLGVQADTAYQRVPPWKALEDSLALTGTVFVAIAAFFGNIIHPAAFVASLKDARSVVGISQMAAEQVKAGPLDYAWFVALLSLSLGAMNILPVPPLDGGKVLVELIERLAGRPLKRELSLAISATGAVLLFSLIAYLMYADIARLAGQ
jgi:regulator of sigma E protease